MSECQPEDKPLPAGDAVPNGEGEASTIEVAVSGNGAAHHGQDSRSGWADGESTTQLLRAITRGIEAMARSQAEQVGTLERVEKVIAGQENLPRMLGETRHLLEQKSTVSRAMFEALHAELKSYKDGFLLESVLRPVIRDLISLFDDVAEIHRQLMLTLSNHQSRGDLTGGSLILFENVLSPVGQLGHNCDAILEVLERLDVLTIPSNTGKLDKRNQRAVSLELAESPDQDQQVVKVVKRGFQWRDRVIRPEEVVIKKWKESHAGAGGGAQEQPVPIQKSA